MNTEIIQVARDALESAPVGVYVPNVPNVPKEPVKPFYSSLNTGIADIFEQSALEGYQSLFMPELALARIGSKYLWHWYATPSLRATGTTKGGSKVVIYTHIPNHFSNPANVRSAINDRRLVNGAVIMPQEAFDSLVAQE